MESVGRSLVGLRGQEILLCFEGRRRAMNNGEKGKRKEGNKRKEEGRREGKEGEKEKRIKGMDMDHGSSVVRFLLLHVRKGHRQADI